MKKILSFAILAFLATATFAQIKKVPYRGAFAPSPVTPWTDKWANFDPQNTVYPSTTVPIGRPANTATAAGANITTNTTWTKNNVYELCGLVYVTNGATLTIEAGTIIRGSAAYANSSLVVCKGAKLKAVGTPDQPIVFTSNYPVGLRGPGNWGGIILLGRAPYNGTSSSTSPVASTSGVNYIEGITEVGAVFPNSTATAASTEFGGGSTPNDNDTSGILKYVRIEFGGYIFSQNKEINGLTFGAVGRGTTIDYVQCSFINDDAFEWFGGTVNCSHLISYRGVDDEFDSDNGFSGTVQFCLGVRDPQIGDNTYAQASGGSTSEGYESDNDATGSSNNPRTKAIFSNMTHIGPLRGNNSTANLAAIYPAFKRMARIRRYSEIKIVNSVLSDYPQGVDFDNGAGNTQQRMLDGYGKFKNNIVSGCQAGKYYVTEGTTATGFVVKDFFINNLNDTTTSASSYLTQPYGTSAYPNAATFTNADYRPIANGLAATGADFSDSTYTMYGWSSDTCLAPSTPASITGSSTITSLVDTLKSYSITLDSAVSVYAWSITGTGNSIKTGQGTNSVTVVVKNPGTLSVTGTNFCAVSAASTLAITCPTPAAPSAIGGDLTITSLVDTLTTLGVAPTAGVSRVWSVTGTGNRIVSGQGTDTIVLVTKTAGTVSVSSSIGCATSSSTSDAITCATPAAPTAIRGDLSISGGADTLSYFGVAPVSGVSNIWTVTGTGNYIKSGQGTDSIVAVTKNTGTVSVVSSIGCATSSSISVTTLCNKPVTATSAISGAKNIISCVDAIQKYSVARTPGYTYSWSVSGTGNGIGGSINAIGDTVNIAMIAAGTVTCTGNTGCQLVTPVTLAVIKTAITVSAPTITAVTTNVCGNRVYRYNSGTSTPVGVNSFFWSFKGNSALTNSATPLRDSANGRYVWFSFSSNAAAATTDSIVVTYGLDCGVLTATKATKLTNAVLNAPVAPASLTVTKIADSVCGQQRYRYTVPAYLAASTSAGAGTGYDWSFKGTIGSTFVVDSGSLSSRIVCGYYTNNSATSTTSLDSVKCRYNSACGYGAYKAAVLAKVAFSTAAPVAPAAPAQAISSDVCGARIYKFTAAALPTAVTTALGTGYVWSFTSGAVASTATFVRDSANGRYVWYSFSSNAAATTADSIKVSFKSLCGNSPYKALKLTNVAKTGCKSAVVKGLITNSSEKTTLFPNPNNGIFTLNVTTGKFENTNATIQVVDMTGKVVYQTNAVVNNGILNSRINNNNLSNGIYTVRYTIGSVTNTVKMVVQK